MLCKGEINTNRIHVRLNSIFLFDAENELEIEKQSTYLELVVLLVLVLAI
jgi:hypothetical protein